MQDFFSKEQQDRIIASIREAEQMTSGEIRIHMEAKCRFDVLDRAVKVFEELGMGNTDLRNGVLVYLAVDDKKFAVIGDKGINEKVPENFWEEMKNLMAAHFKRGEFEQGLCNGILLAGKQLKEHFPLSANDKNELSDSISFGPKN
jgi:uncharacterized membrane protein